MTLFLKKFISTGEITSKKFLLRVYFINLEMSLELRLTKELEQFEEKTDGIYGSCIVATDSALMMAEASNSYDRDVIQAMSVKIISSAKDTLNLLLGEGKLMSITIEEENHFLYVRKINSEYHVVVLTDKSEAMGLRELNVRELISSLSPILGS